MLLDFNDRAVVLSALTRLTELSLLLIIIMEPWPDVSLVMAFSFTICPLSQIG